jgi:hypothetical protein
VEVTTHNKEQRNDHRRRTPSTDRLFDRRHPDLDYAAVAQLHCSDLFDRLGDFGARADSLIRP